MDIVNKRFNLQSRYIDYHTSTELPIVNRNEEDISGLVRLIEGIS